MTSAAPPHDRFERATPLWYLAIDGGLATTAAMAMSSSVYDAIAAKVPVPPRKVTQAIWYGSIVVHIAEATYAYRVAKAAGMHRSAARWAAETMIVGFPSILKLQSIAAEQ
jgi:hypothetical protein